MSEKIAKISASDLRSFQAGGALLYFITIATVLLGLFAYGANKTRFHQQSQGIPGNFKLVNADGPEMVINDAGQVVRDPIIMGTFNFVNNSTSSLGQLWIYCVELLSGTPQIMPSTDDLGNGLTRVLGQAAMIHNRSGNSYLYLTGGSGGRTVTGFNTATYMRTDYVSAMLGY